MAVPPEVAWLVPVVVPLLIGILVGAIIKKTIKLLLSLTALIIILVATGFLSVTFQDLYDSSMKLLPRIIQTGYGSLDILPYSSTVFLVGLALGLWKG